MTTLHPIDVDAHDTAGRDLWIALEDHDTGADVQVLRVDRSTYPPEVTHLASMDPDEAHHLGTKLRLAAKKARERARST